jgi:general secretion pathway protein F
LRFGRDALLLAMPGLSSLLLRIETARFSRMLGMLLSGGVAVLPAMDIANQCWSLLPLKRVGEAARETLREGGSLAEALSRAAIPHMAIRLIAVGEQSGELDAMLLRVAEHYEQEVSRRLQWMLTIAEPLLVMLMAVGVGALAMAVLLPIVQMNSLIR